MRFQGGFVGFGFGSLISSYYVTGRRLLQVCQNPNLLCEIPLVAGSKAPEERDGGRLSAGREMPVIVDGDGEQEREVWALSAGNMGTLCRK